MKKLKLWHIVVGLYVIGFLIILLFDRGDDMSGFIAYFAALPGIVILYLIEAALISYGLRGIQPSEFTTTALVGAFITAVILYFVAKGISSVLRHFSKDKQV